MMCSSVQTSKIEREQKKYEWNTMLVAGLAAHRVKSIVITPFSADIFTYREILYSMSH